MSVVYENVFILQTAFWRGQIAFVCRGQKAQESSCQIKISQILKSRLYPSDQCFSFLNQAYYSTQYCFGTPYSALPSSCDMFTITIVL